MRRRRPAQARADKHFAEYNPDAVAVASGLANSSIVAATYTIQALLQTPLLAASRYIRKRWQCRVYPDFERNEFSLQRFGAVEWHGTDNDLCQRDAA